VKANFLYENKLYEKAISCNQEIVNALKKNADVFKKEDTELYQKYLCNLSSALTNLGWVLVETAKSKEKVNKGIEKIQEGYEMVQKTGRKKLLAHILFYLARAFFKLVDYDKAREFFMKSKSIAEKELFLDLIAFNHWGLALTYEAKGDKRSSEQYLMLAKSEIKKVEEDTLEKKEVEEYLESKAKGI
jgi:tetratricopeptide (TPR) repeat protein